MLQLSKSEACKGSNHLLHWTTEQDAAFDNLKLELLKPLAPLLLNAHKPFVIRTDASDYAMGAVLEQTDENWNHYLVVARWMPLSPPLLNCRHRQTLLSSQRTMMF